MTTQTIGGPSRPLALRVPRAVSDRVRLAAARVVTHRYALAGSTAMLAAALGAAFSA